MTLDDFRRLNFREVGSWPWLPKIIVLLLVMLFIVGLGAFFDWKDQWETLGAAEQDEVKLKGEYTQKKAKQLPNRSEIDALLTDINQAGLGRGLQFDLFRPAPQEKMADFYAELPINIKITGNYHDIGAFASDVAALPRIVTLNDVAISNDKGTLSMDAVAKTFRYLDEEEIAKQRALQKAAKDKAKK